MQAEQFETKEKNIPQIQAFQLLLLTQSSTYLFYRYFVKCIAKQLLRRSCRSGNGMLYIAEGDAGDKRAFLIHVALTTKSRTVDKAEPFGKKLNERR